MGAEIKILEFAEGVETGSPNEILSYSAANLISTDTTLTIASDDLTNVVVAEGVGTEINLPDPVENNGRIITVKRLDSTNNITINPYSGHTIDDQASITLNMNYQSRTIVCNETIGYVII